jgi:adenosylcobinamide kinase / adenosylcobinamide-phosphate guanylyltransferase
MPGHDRASAQLPPLTLVLGGARSGKSRHAEALVESGAPEALYLATAEPRDDEMRQRIAAHRARRGPRWTTLEEPLALVPALAAASRPQRPVLVDCLTLWLSNLLEAERDVAAEIDALAASLPQLAGPVVLVANEVGLGIVPSTGLARAFRDHAGRLNRDVAARCDRVIFVAAGLPLVLKDGAGAAR